MLSEEKTNIMRSFYLLTLSFVCEVCIAEIMVLDQYKNFLNRFGKDVNRISDPSRVSKFAETVSLIERKNKNLKDFRLELNEMADWNQEELRARFRALPRIDAVDRTLFEVPFNLINYYDNAIARQMHQNCCA